MIKHLLPLTLAIAMALPLTFSALGAAERTDTTTTTTTTSLNKDDVKFLQMANQGGLLEIKTSELVAKRNVTGAAADYAKKMITEHESVNKELSSLASKKGVTLPTALDVDTQKKYDSLVKVDDAKLGKEYMEAQVKAHKAAVSSFKDAADDSMDVDVKAIATKHFPHLQAHLDEAKRIEDTL